MNKAAYGAAVAGFVALVVVLGCRPNISLSEEGLRASDRVILAESDGGFVLSAQDFYSGLSKSTLLMNGGVFDTRMSKYLLDSVVLDTLAGLAASEVELEDYYTIYCDYSHQYYDYLVQTYWEETVYKKVTVDSQEAVDFFYEHPDLFTVEEQVDLYHILVSQYSLKNGPDSAYYRSLSAEDMQHETAEYADKLWRLLNYGEAFENVAYVFSHDASSREHGGYMGWTPRDRYLDPFDSIAFSLQPGEYSRPYHDKDGWHIIYISGHLSAGPVPIDSSGVYESAYQTLLTHRSNIIVEARLDSLSKEINIVPNEAILDSNTNIHLVDDRVWAGILNGRDTIDCRILKRFEEVTRRKYDVDNTTPDMKLEMLEAASQRFIQVQAARAEGIDTLPKVVAKKRQLIHSKSKSIVQRDSYAFNWTPPESVVDAYYYDHIDEFIVEKPIRVQHIIVNDLSFAEFLREQALSGVEMADLASEHKGSGYKIKFADLGYIGPDDVSNKYYRTALGTQVGSISRVIRTESGDFQILKVLEQKQSRSIELSRGEIRMRMKKEHNAEVWRDYRDRMFARYNVRFPVKVSEIHLGNYHVRNR